MFLQQQTMVTSGQAVGSSRRAAETGTGSVRVAGIGAENDDEIAIKTGKESGTAAAAGTGVGGRFLNISE